MSERVLFVDDEPQLLSAIQLTLRKHVQVQTAASAAQGLLALQESGPFALVISDMRMPGMNGAQFLSKVRELAPQSVRMILSGQSDIQAAIDAVNDAQIYRFLSKPCPPDQLLAAIKDGLQQYRLLTAEKVLLEQTLSGSVKMLIEILGMVSPTSSNRASRLQRYTQGMSTALGLTENWQSALAAHLSQIGCVALPQGLMAKVEAGEMLDDEERRLYESHPEVAGKLLAAIPRLEDVAAIVTSQFVAPSFAGKPDDLRQWDVRSVGQVLLVTAIEFDRLTLRGAPREVAVEKLRTHPVGRNAALLKAVQALHVANHERVLRQLRVKDLMPGMILDQDLVSPKGIRLVPSGHEVTRSLIVRLTSIADGVGVSEPFRVLVSV
jgi:response regulator RpfG family c-di-GMP phosphodiesterase